jgi:hypothetical protein
MEWDQWNGNNEKTVINKGLNFMAENVAQLSKVDES